MYIDFKETVVSHKPDTIYIITKSKTRIKEFWNCQNSELKTCM